MDVVGFRAKHVDIHIQEVLAPHADLLNTWNRRKVLKNLKRNLGNINIHIKVEIPSVHRYPWIWRKPGTKL